MNLYQPAEGAAYGLGVSDDGATLVAVIGFGFDLGGQIVALDPVSGAARWSVETSESPSRNPVVVDDVAFVGMENLVGGGAAIYTLDAASGDRLWRTDVERRDLPATPVDAVSYADGKLFVNRGDAVLLKLDAASGAIEWEIELDKPTRGAPDVFEGTIYVESGFDGARLLALDVATDEERWSMEDAANPVTGPTIGEGSLFVPYSDGTIAAYEPDTGEECWHVLAGVVAEGDASAPWPGLPSIAGGVLYVSSNGFAGAHTLALDAQTGAEQWSVPTGDFSTGSLALMDGQLLVGSDSGELIALDPETGTERWRFEVPNKIELDLDQASPPLARNGLIFTRDDAGGIVALALQRS